MISNRMKAKQTSRFTGILKKLRLAHGFTHQNIADALGCNRATYTYYESGKTIPGIVILEKLADLYDIPLANLLSGQLSYTEPSQKRPSKKVVDDIEAISGLTSDEKSIIAILRTKESGFAQKLLRQLKAGSE